MSKHTKKHSAMTRSWEMARLLIVDDEEDIVHLLRHTFEQLGMQVTAFTDPARALASFKSGTYELALLDVRMPGMSGFELYKSLKQADGKIKACFLTAFELYGEDLAQNQISSADVNCFIKKPIKIGELVNRVKTVLEG